MSDTPPLRALRPLLGAALLLAASCRRADEYPALLPERTAPVESTSLFRTQPIGLPVEGYPWIAHVRAVDLDRDGLVDVLVCDARRNQVAWIRQVAPGHFEESILQGGVPAPVHAEAVDFDGDGDLDVLVAVMGEIFPNNDRIGAILVLENDGRQNFRQRVIVDRIARVTDVQAGDLDGDGRLDLAVAQFGYDQGEIRWMKNLGG